MTNPTKTQAVKSCEIQEDNHVETISPIKGYWFYFEDGKDEIVVFGSGWSGKEIVYFNDNEVSQCRNMKFVSTHKFTKNSKRYEIVYSMDSLLKGSVSCSLSINGVETDKQTKAVFAKGGFKTAWKSILVFFAVGMVFGYIGAKIAIYIAGL